MDAYIGLQHPSVAAVVAPFAHLFLPPSNSLNSYSKYREAKGFTSKGLPQPDLRECDCRGGSGAASGEQAGAHLSKNGWPRLVPHGFTDLEHFAAVHSVTEYPMDSAVALSSTAEYAIDTVCELGEEVSKWRQAKRRQLHAIARRLDPVSELLFPLAPKACEHFVRKCHPAFVLFFCTYPTRCVLGFCLVGDIESPPIFRRSRPPHESPPVRAFEEQAEVFNAELLSSMAPPRRPGEAEALVALAEKDLKGGFRPLQAGEDA